MMNRLASDGPSSTRVLVLGLDMGDADVIRHLRLPMLAVIPPEER